MLPLALVLLTVPKQGHVHDRTLVKRRRKSERRVNVASMPAPKVSRIMFTQIQDEPGQERKWRYTLRDQRQ